MDASAFLETLQRRRGYRGQIAGVRSFAPREAEYRTPQAPLPDALKRLLAREEITELYSPSGRQLRRHHRR